MSLQDYWKLPPSGKDRIVLDMPATKTPKQNRRCRRCRLADARECFMLRQPAIASIDELRCCDCECHSY